MQRLQSPVTRMLVLLAVTYGLALLWLSYAQERLIFHPRPLPRKFQFSYPVSFDEYLVPVDDGGRVSAVVLHPPCNEIRGTAFFFHGNAATIQHFHVQAREIVRRCWDTVMVDYRPFGKSTGEVTEETLSTDGEAVYKAVKGKKERVVIYGHSLGSYPATALALKVPSEALILEAPFQSLARRASEQYPYLRVEWVLKYPLRTDLLLEQLFARQDPKPPQLLLFHGTNDQVISVGHSRDIKNLYPNQVAYYELEGGTHFNVPSFSSYQDTLSQLLGAPENDKLSLARNTLWMVD